MNDNVTVCEVGPRDGLQMAHSRMATADKIGWIEAIAASGMPEIEVGSFVPARVIPQMADTGEVVRAVRGIPSLIVALAPNLKGAQLAAEAGARRVTIPVSVSEGHSRANTNRSTDEAVAEVARICAWAKESGAAIEIEAGMSTAFGCSIDGVVPERRVVEVAAALAAAGADLIALADTVGYGHPAQIRSVVRAVRAEIGGKLEGLHLHDTMGLGLANALAGLQLGIAHFDSSCAGLGGCPFAGHGEAAGNICTEDLVFMCHEMGIETGVDLERLLDCARMAEEIVGHRLPGSLLRTGSLARFRAGG